MLDESVPSAAIVEYLQSHGYESHSRPARVYDSSAALQLAAVGGGEGSCKPPMSLRCSCAVPCHVGGCTGKAASMLPATTSIAESSARAGLFEGVALRRLVRMEMLEHGGFVADSQGSAANAQVRRVRTERRSGADLNCARAAAGRDLVAQEILALHPHTRVRLCGQSDVVNTN